MTVYFSDLDDYGKNTDINVIFQKYKLFFDGKYSTEQIIYAIHTHCDRSLVIPKVPHLNAILNPPEIKITEAQFVEAQKWQDKNGWPGFSDAQDTIDKYREQVKAAQTDRKIKCDTIKALVNDSTRRLTW